MSQIVEKTVNICIILVTLLVAYSVVRDQLLRPPVDPQQSALRAGSRLRMNGVSATGADATLVFVLSTQCHFCSESLGLYKQITGLVGRNPSRLRFVGVFPQEQKIAEAYLLQHGIVFDSVVSAPLSELKISGTPTVLLLDKAALVKRMWIGKLDPSRSDELVTTVKALCPSCG